WFEWQVPEGDWTLMRFVCANTGERLKVPSPQSDGLATDHFSRVATRTFIETLTQRLQQRLGDLRHTRIKQLYLPSYEVVGAKWTPDFLEQFRTYRHYDMTPFLPVLAGHQIESDEQTLRFIYDFRKTLGDLLVDAYYRTASETAREAGLGIEAEAGGPGPPVHQVPVDALKALGAIDEMRGEFWPWRPDRNQLWVVKETACAAHVYGRRRVSMEAFTGFRHWEDGPFDLKPWADRAFCEGMNRVVWHTASHQPPEAGKPGWVYGAGSHLTPNLVWWPLAKPFLTYLSRCSFLLQQGLFVGDVCYYYGDQGYNFVPPKHVDPSLGVGYDYDVANPEVILKRMQVRDGRIALPDGMQYELLVLPDREDFDLAVLQRIGELVEAGATVVGPKPVRSNGLTDYPQRDDQVRRLANRIWGDCDGQRVRIHHYGKGRVIHGRPLREILAERGIGPDFQFTSPRADTQLDYIHRRTSQADIYFVRNKRPHAESVQATFRVTGKAPELWDPQSGQTDRLVVYQQTAHGIQIPLSLDPFGSVFVVFRKPVSANHFRSASPGLRVRHRGEQEFQVTAFEQGAYQLETPDDRSVGIDIDNLPQPIKLTGPWQVHFPADWGAPESVILPELMSWTDHNDIGIRHFSGIARYEISFDLPPDWLQPSRQIHLDLGRLWAVGKVSLNDRPLGVLWAPPYRVELTAAARAGTNKLEIEIANTWANRLVGDTQLPPDQRFCQTNIQVSGTPGRPWKDIPLRHSGLLGPVRLIPAQEQRVSLTRSHPQR
ncbi:MAG: glycosyl transferase family 2, partial [Planctomycetes bacterium]|nr:glycosyl transferase family 2 [Planctomycetota bacterium]